MGSLPRHFFTADNMFGDEHAATRRGFDSVGEMDAAMAQAWNSVVDERDLVWVLGNFTSAGRSPMAGLLDALNGAKYLVAGELDPVFAPNALDEKRLKSRVDFYREQGFKAVITGSGIARKFGHPLTVPVRGWSGLDHPRVIVSHFPFDMIEDERDGPDRFAKWRPKRPRSPRGGDMPWLLHGHGAEWRVRRDQVNVGADKWGLVPVDAQMVVDLIEEGSDAE